MAGRDGRRRLGLQGACSPRSSCRARRRRSRSASTTSPAPSRRCSTTRAWRRSARRSATSSTPTSPARPRRTSTPEIEEVHSDKQLALALGADVSWLGSAATISSSFDWSQTNTKSRYLVRYTQAYYTVDVDQPGRPSDFLDPLVTLATSSPRSAPANPPLYVSSVTYGRMVVFTFESQYSAQELGAALDFAYSGGVDVSGDVSVTYKDIISQSKITAFILGGSGGMAAQTIDSYDDLMEFIKGGGDWSKDSPGAPIAYKLSYLQGQAPGRISLTTDYDVKDCERVSQKIKITVKSHPGRVGGRRRGQRPRAVRDAVGRRCRSRRPVLARLQQLGPRPRGPVVPVERGPVRRRARGDALAGRRDRPRRPPDRRGHRVRRRRSRRRGR